MKKIEVTQSPFADFDVDRVKNLLGNLYMELLFPHNDREDSFFSAIEEEKGLRPLPYVGKSRPGFLYGVEISEE